MKLKVAEIITEIIENDGKCFENIISNLEWLRLFFVWYEEFVVLSFRQALSLLFLVYIELCNCLPLILLPFLLFNSVLHPFSMILILALANVSHVYARLTENGIWIWIWICWLLQLLSAQSDTLDIFYSKLELEFTISNAMHSNGKFYMLCPQCGKAEKYAFIYHTSSYDLAVGVCK